MKIYFACSISGGRQDETTYQYLVGELIARGVNIPNIHITESGIVELDNREDPSDIYHRDVTWIDESDVLVAEVSTPSHGVGYEIGYALKQNKPVFCIYRQGVVVSKMILGNPHPNLTIYAYSNWEDAIDFLTKQLQLS